MPSQKLSLRKRENKKKKRRFGPLKGKLKDYARLPGVEMVVLIGFDKTNRDRTIRKEFWGFLSKRNIPWMRNIDNIVSYLTYSLDFFLLISFSQLSNEANQIEVLDEIDSEAEIFPARLDEAGYDTSNALVVLSGGSRKLEMLDMSAGTAAAYQLLPEFDLNLLYDVMSFC